MITRIIFVLWIIGFGMICVDGFLKGYYHLYDSEAPPEGINN